MSVLRMAVLDGAADLVYLMRGALTAEGWDVQIFPDAEALATARGAKPHVVLLDIATQREEPCGGLRDRLGAVEAAGQTGWAGGPRAVKPVEAVQEPLTILRRERRSLIAHRRDHRVALAEYLDRDLGVRRSICDGVLQK